MRPTFVDDPWSPDDPAVRRLREALALTPTPEPVQNGPGRPQTPSVAPASDRELVESLRARVASGDRSALEPLRRLIERIRNRG